MDISAYSLIALARGALPLMEKRGGGSILTLTYLGSERVFQNYNVMGVAKAALEATRPLSRRRSRPEEHPRQRDLGRADQDAGGVGHSGFSSILQHLSRSRAAAAHGRDRRGRRRGDVPPRRRRPRGHRRSADGRRRLSRDGHVSLPKVMTPVAPTHNNRRAKLVLLLPCWHRSSSRRAARRSANHRRCTITTRVKTALLNDPAVGLQKIDVEYIQGRGDAVRRGGDRGGRAEAIDSRAKSRASGTSSRRCRSNSQGLRNAIHEPISRA